MDLTKLPVQVESIAEPAFMLDLDGLVLAWNKAAERYFGRTSEAAVGQRCPALILGRRLNGEPICRLDCPWIQGLALLPGRPATELMVRAATPGTKQLATLVSVPLSDPTGRPIALLHVLVPHDKSSEAATIGSANGVLPVRVGK